MMKFHSKNLKLEDFHHLEDPNSEIFHGPFWSVKNCGLGMAMCWLLPYLIIHGGNTGSEPVGDVWVN